MKPLKLPLPDPDDRYSSIDPFDCRYFDQEVARYLSEASRLRYQAHIEAALAYTLAEFDVCKKTVADEIAKSTAKINPAHVYAEEKITKHDIKALVNCIKKGVNSQAKPYVHFGATSYDIIATAQVLQTKNFLDDVLSKRLNTLVKTLISLSNKYSDTTQIGRTHGQHALPITFGFALAEYVERLGNSTLAIRDLSTQLRGKFSGAVGAYNALSVFVSNPKKFERSLLGRIGLEPADYSTQIIPPENMIRILDELAITSGIMANLAHDMRHLQRSEIAEIRENFEQTQTGSSTMAHKKNPINFENVASLHKQVLAQCLNANQNISSEHQRDLTDSASSRFYCLSLAIVASMAARLDQVMRKIEIDKSAMVKNLRLSEGAIAAEPLYLLLAKLGLANAHEKAKHLSHRALSKKKPLMEVLSHDREAKKYWAMFSPREKRLIESPERYYCGLSAKKARQICAKWRKKL